MAQQLNDMLENGIKEVETLQEISRKLVELKVTTSQLRKFFGALKRIDADFENLKTETILLEPKLAYAVGRAKKDSNEQKGLKNLYDNLSPLIKKIGSDKTKFKNLVRIVEAIVAYHKFYETK